MFYDVHLGHRRTFTKSVIEGFDPIFENEVELATWDCIFFPGDLFDNLLYLTNQYLDEIIYFFARLLKLCKKHDIVVRILHGTPGHDYKQSHLLPILNLAFDFKVDLKFIHELSIEYIERFNIHVLYVPDEWNVDVHETYAETLALLNARGLQAVDFCLFHGAFNYQIDERLNPKSHNEELWCNLVNHYIFAGHVHFRSQYKKIIVGGSFDRLAHGEEAPKGWVTCHVKPDGDDILFHENKNATIYKTIDIRNLSIEEAIDKITKTCEGYPKSSHIRLHVTDKDSASDALKTIRNRFSYFHVTQKTDKRETEKQQKTLKLVEQQFQSISLTPDNISRLLSERLNKLPNVNQDYVLSQLSKYI